MKVEMNLKPIIFKRETADAFEAFRRTRSGDAGNMVTRVLQDELFTGSFSPLNQIPAIDLLQAIFVGYELEQTPEEKLQEKIREAKNNRNMLNAFDVDQHQLDSRYIDGLEEAARIMNVI